MHGVGAGDGGAGADQFDVRIAQRLLVKAGKAGDLLFLGGDKGAPVEARFSDMPAEAARVCEVVPEAAGQDIKLLGHAAANDAGSADAELLGDGDLRAMAR